MTDSGAQVRLRMIEALSRRAQAHQGEVRRMLDEKLAALQAAHDQALAAMPDVQADTPTETVKSKAPGHQRVGPLAQLTHYIAQHRSPEASGPSATTGELEDLRYFRSVWSRLSADKRLTQSLAKVPDKAGPLNSHHLVHRALSAMREASPDYFHHFVSYVDALMCLDRLHAAGSAPAAAEKASQTPSPRTRKTARAK